MRELGGFLEIERGTGDLYHHDCLFLNSGRNCLRYLIRARRVTSIALPGWICDSIVETCREEGVQLHFYHVDETLGFTLPDELPNDCVVYIVNYYGQIDYEWLDAMLNNGLRIILDNVQAFFSPAPTGVDTIYSPRKFFGVPDGGILYTSATLNTPLEQDESRNRLAHLYGRFETNARGYYDAFRKAEEEIGKMPLMRMSKITENALRGVDYDSIRSAREANYSCLHDRLRVFNRLKPKKPIGPFAYPLLLKSAAPVRERLIKQGVFIPVLWPETRNSLNANGIERKLADNILPLPCDQRYGIEEMAYIADSVVALLNKSLPHSRNGSRLGR